MLEAWMDNQVIIVLSTETQFAASSEIGNNTFYYAFLSGRNERRVLSMEPALKRYSVGSD